MYKKVSTKIIMILVTAAIVTVLSSVLQVSNAQSNTNLQSVLDIHNQERARSWSSAAHLERQCRNPSPGIC